MVSATLRHNITDLSVVVDVVLPSSSKTLMTRLHITCEGTIEEHGYGMLQVRVPFRSSCCDTI